MFPPRVFELTSGGVAVAWLTLAGCSESAATRGHDASSSRALDAAGSSTDGASDGATTESGGAFETDGCHPPSGATALCLTFVPESIAAEPERGLDQRGFLTLQVFRTPNPPGGARGSAAALYERTFPEDAASGGEVSLAELPVSTIVLPDAPSTVFVRALFFDNRPWDDERGLTWGTWLGGSDLSRTLTEDTALKAIPLEEGHVAERDIPLTALRRLTATVTTSIAPVGDGEGALSVVASREPGLPPHTQTHGYGIEPCVDVNQGPQRVEMILLGSGTFFVTGYFDDLGIETPGQLPPGMLLTVDPDYLATSAAFEQVTLGAQQYSAAVSLDLKFMSSLPSSTSPLGPNSCADLGFPRRL